MNQFFYCSRILYPFSCIGVENCTSGILCLYFILKLKSFKNIAGVIDRQLSRISIKWLNPLFLHLIVRRHLNIRIFFLVNLCQSVRSTFRWRRFKIIIISSLSLKFYKPVSHEFKNIFCKFLSFLRRNIFPKKI
ncbi:MAG: hypothetical protein A4E66_02294 [Syntrophus sp. PtaB.Bin001]|nr:MAG: hypothetical protein A4E66_02294 [Syntrophus sp. PtaB.Bin001]